MIRLPENLMLLANSAAGAVQAIAADHGAIEDPRLDADQRTIANGATVQHDLMPNRYIAADGERISRVRVQHAALLHVRAVADDDRFVVAAEHGVRPDV